MVSAVYRQLAVAWQLDSRLGFGIPVWDFYDARPLAHVQRDRITE